MDISFERDSEEAGWKLLWFFRYCLKDQQLRFMAFWLKELKDFKFYIFMSIKRVVILYQIKSIPHEFYMNEFYMLLMYVK